MTHQTVEYFPTSDVLALMFDNNDASLGQLQPNSLDQDSLKYDLPPFPEEPCATLKPTRAFVPPT